MENHANNPARQVADSGGNATDSFKGPRSGRELTRDEVLGCARDRGRLYRGRESVEESIARLKSKAGFRPGSDCWWWTGSLFTGGRGAIRFRGRQWSAPRLSYALFVGTIPAGVCVCHKCDNPKCFNPDHLFLGSQRENMLDCTRKGRNKAAKLNAESVRKILELRRTGLGYVRIARAIGGIGPLAVRSVIKGEAWRHAIPAALAGRGGGQ